MVSEAVFTLMVSVFASQHNELDATVTSYEPGNTLLKLYLPPLRVAVENCPLRAPLASSAFRVIEISLQSRLASDKHLTSPTTVARSCENIMPDTGDADTSIFCWSGKNLRREKKGRL